MTVFTHKHTHKQTHQLWADPAPQGGLATLHRRALLAWQSGPPSSALLVKKAGDRDAAAAMRRVADFLAARGVRVLAERAVVAAEFPDLTPFAPEAGSDDDETVANQGHATDPAFCVTLGGDGTVLRVASLFGRDAPLPPVVPLAMGSLGFLTPFDAAAAEDILSTILAAGTDAAPVFCTLRTRRACRVLAPDGTPVGPPRLVLNECLIDRGASPAMVTLDVAIDGGAF